MKACGSYHPVTSFFYFLAVLSVTVFVWHPVLQAAALLGGLLLFFMLEETRAALRACAFYLGLFLLTAATNPLFSHNGVTPLFFLNGNAVTLEACCYGLSIGCAVTAVLLWCRCYQEIMTTDKFLYLFASVVPALSLLLSAAIRFVPLFRRKMRAVRLAQKGLGLYAANTYFDRIRGAIRVFLAMVAWSMEHAVETANAMKARGYGMKGRSSFSLFRFTGRDAAFLLCTALCLAATLYGACGGALTYAFYPKMHALSRTYDALLSYGAFAVLALLPAAVEVKENLKWNLCRSNI